MEICLAKKEHSEQIANIHQQEIKGGFLSSLKTPFLIGFYEAIILSDEGFCVVCIEGGNIIGFVSGVESLKNFYKFFIKKYFFRLFISLFSKIFSLGSLKKIAENIFYPKNTKEFPEAELLTFAVKNGFQGMGIGKKLLEEFDREMDRRKVKKFKVLVGKEMRAADFYKKNGFSCIDEIALHGKEISLVLVRELK